MHIWVWEHIQLLEHLQPHIWALSACMCTFLPQALISWCVVEVNENVCHAWYIPPGVAWSFLQTALGFIDKLIKKLSPRKIFEIPSIQTLRAACLNIWQNPNHYKDILRVGWFKIRLDHQYIGFFLGKRSYYVYWWS